MNFTDRIAILFQIAAAAGCLLATAFGAYRLAAVCGVCFAIVMLLDIRMMLLALVHETIRMQNGKQEAEEVEADPWVAQEFQP